MSGALYAVFVVGILVVIHWYITNERIGQDSDGSKGVLAMQSEREPEANTNAAGRNGRTQGTGPKRAATKLKPNR